MYGLDMWREETEAAVRAVMKTNYVEGKMRWTKEKMDKCKRYEGCQCVRRGCAE